MPLLILDNPQPPEDNQSQLQMAQNGSGIGIANICCLGAGGS